MSSGSGWNIWVWLAGGVCLVGVVVRRYIDFLILPIPTPLVNIYALFCSSILTYCSFFVLFDWKSAIEHDSGV